MTRMGSLVLGSLVVLAVTTTACGQAVDRLGNEPAAPVTLRAETPFDPDEVQPYAHAVAAASDDLVRLASARDRESDSGRRARHHRAGAIRCPRCRLRRHASLDELRQSTAMTPCTRHSLSTSYDLRGSRPRQLDLRRCRHRPRRARAHLDGSLAGTDARAWRSGTRARRARRLHRRTARDNQVANQRGDARRAGRERHGDRPGWRHRGPRRHGGADLGAMGFDGTSAIRVVTGNVVLWPRRDLGRRQQGAVRQPPGRAAGGAPRLRSAPLWTRCSTVLRAGRRGDDRHRLSQWGPVRGRESRRALSRCAMRSSPSTPASGPTPQRTARSTRSTHCAPATGTASPVPPTPRHRHARGQGDRDRRVPGLPVPPRPRSSPRAAVSVRRRSTSAARPCTFDHGTFREEGPAAGPGAGHVCADGRPPAGDQPGQW